MSSFFAFLKRMRFINRWSLMRNTETENIQEHSLEVAMVAHNLAALKNEYFGGNLDINKVAVIAMYHEVSEIFTGVCRRLLNTLILSFVPCMARWKP